MTKKLQVNTGRNHGKTLLMVKLAIDAAIAGQKVLFLSPDERSMGRALALHDELRRRGLK